MSARHRSVGERASAAWFRFRSGGDLKLVQQAALKKQQGDKNKEHQLRLRKNIEYYDSQIQLHQKRLLDDKNDAWRMYGAPAYKKLSSDLDLFNETRAYRSARHHYDKENLYNSRIDKNNMMNSWLDLRQKRMQDVQKLRTLMSKS